MIRTPNLRTAMTAVSLLAVAACADTNAQGTPGAPDAGQAAAQDVAQASARSDVPEVTAPAGTYVSDPGHTSLHWKIGHMGLSDYTARMGDVEMMLAFDPDDLAATRIEAVIDPRSVDTGYEGDKDFDEEIASPLILDAGAHPMVRFVSTAVRPTGPDTADVDGDLTLMGTTRPVTLNATYHGSMASHPFAEVPAVGFSASTTIDRTAWGLDFLSGQGLSDDVEIEVQAEFLRQGA